MMPQEKIEKRRRRVSKNEEKTRVQQSKLAENNKQLLIKDKNKLGGLKYLHEIWTENSEQKITFVKACKKSFIKFNENKMNILKLFKLLTVIELCILFFLIVTINYSDMSVESNNANYLGIVILGLLVFGTWGMAKDKERELK